MFPSSRTRFVQGFKWEMAFMKEVHDKEHFEHRELDKQRKRTSSERSLVPPTCDSLARLE